MKKSFTAGLIILLPFALTVWVVVYLFDLFTNPIFNLLETLLRWYENTHHVSFVNHETLITFISRVAALILTFVFIVILGFLARRFFFDALLSFINKMIIRIPIVGTIYRLTKDVTKAMITTDNKKAFKETILIPFPSPETYTLGFITGEVPASLQQFIPHTTVTVFVPTAPHPMSGFVLFCTQESIHQVPISVEDTFKFLLSCGVLLPNQPKP